jgi:hypothetical protein
MAVEYCSLQDSAILVQSADGKRGGYWQLVNPELAPKIAQSLAE